MHCALKTQWFGAKYHSTVYSYNSIKATESNSCSISTTPGEFALVHGLALQRVRLKQFTIHNLQLKFTIVNAESVLKFF